MDDRTGIIYQQNQNETLAELSTRFGVPENHLIPLGNMPNDGCQKCKGTGIKKITASGRRIPCQCTNPIK